MVKPVGPVCNLDCSYCYYLQKKDLFTESDRFRMADDLLETYIVQHIEASPSEQVFFSWHGGEPTLLGLDYFQKIVDLQNKHRPSGRTLHNGIQTNGTLLDEDWCRFLAKNRFQVGLSLDGPKELHDRYRLTKGQKATHKQVMQAFKLLQKYRVNFDVLCVVHNLNARQPGTVYRFFKDIGVTSLQFLPLIVRQGETGTSPETVPAAAYGRFLSSIFDEWVRHDIGRVFVQNFDEALRPYTGTEHALCVSRETCGDVVVVEHNGDFYSCDHFVDDGHRIGNIFETSLAEMLASPAQRHFGNQKRDALPRYCRDCEVLSSCNGGCPKDRFTRTPDGEAGLSYLCPGLKLFYSHARPTLQKLAEIRQSENPEAELLELIRPAAAHQAGRNDPCPCGSGKKFKKCCLV
ncbi:MAG: anaerobic sulfatase maturase [Rhodospirillales bacterium]|nr:anaerobic sulfatase maturase [Rhodospirillales bacterium]